MNQSQFASIAQHEVVEVLKIAGYAAAAAVCTFLLNQVPGWHLSAAADTIVTTGLVPALKFGVAFFSGKAAQPTAPAQ